MEVILESYLLATRQITPWGARQARLLSERANQKGVRSLLLLLLHWNERGAGGVGIEHLSQVLSPESLQIYKVSLGADWQEEWEKLSATSYLDECKDQWRRMLADPQQFSPLFGTPQQSPLPLVVIDNVREQFAFSRSFVAVRTLEKTLQERLQQVVVLPENFRNILKSEFSKSSIRFHYRQVAACILALRTRLFIISGGPGTGKTSVVLQLLRLLQSVESIPQERMALCAPTGRAKARMAETVHASFPQAVAQTLHSLLVQRPDGSFRYNRSNPLPYAVVVLDEASMVDLHLFAGLLDAMHPSSRLILIGDMHQLPSVDAGAVLGDLTEVFQQSEMLGSCSEAGNQWLQNVLVDIATDNPKNESTSLQLEEDLQMQAGPLCNHVVVLNHTYRSALGIQQACLAINRGDSATLRKHLKSGDPHIRMQPFSDSRLAIQWLSEWWQCKAQLDFIPKGISLQDSRLDSILHDEFAKMLSARLLVLSHHGDLGRVRLNSLAHRIYQKVYDANTMGSFFHGQHIMATQNQHDLGVFNGDLGLMIHFAEGMRAVFQIGGQFQYLPLDFLSGLEESYAMTVHKAQGSEFDEVAFLLPEQDTPLLNRQILYTGITRAKKSVTILGNMEMLERGVARRDERPGGIQLVS